jgi:hypothetical protein
VARLPEGDKMAVLCREFDISRRTGYKLFSRYKNSGISNLIDRSRQPYRHANRLPVSDREPDLEAEGGTLQLGRSQDPCQDQAPPQHDTD